MNCCSELAIMNLHLSLCVVNEASDCQGNVECLVYKFILIQAPSLA